MKRALLTCMMLLTMMSGGGAADLAVSNVVQQQPYNMPWFVHVGVGGIFMSEGAKIDVAGYRQDGATVRIRPQYTLMFEAGRYLSPNWAVSISGGIPPRAYIDGAGTLTGAGRLASTVYGPVSVTAHYHFPNFGAFQPYVGAGPVGLLVFSTKDGLMTNTHIENSVGFAVQAGADYMLTDHWGLYVDVKKAILRTRATGLVFGMPANAKVKLDPLVSNIGLTYRF